MKTHTLEIEYVFLFSTSAIELVPNSRNCLFIIEAMKSEQCHYKNDLLPPGTQGFLTLELESSF